MTDLQLKQLDRIRLRKTIIRLAMKHQRPGTGSSIEFLRSRTTNMTFPDLFPVLGEILWAVVGAAAVRLYMPERMTRDLDVVILREDEAEARRRLLQAGFSYGGDLAIPGSQWTAPDGFPVDLLLLDMSWGREALNEAQQNRDAQGLPVLPLPYLILMKFAAGRAQDVADVARMLGQADEKGLLAVRALFEQWAPSELEDLESLIVLGRMEFESPGA